MAREAMTKRATGMAGALVTLVLGLAFAGALSAQTTTTTSVDVHNFEVIAVDGDRLVLRDERGTNEYTVPNDFRFTVDGKKMAVSELKAGMKGTATVTTTTKTRPVVITEIRQGVVVKTAPTSVTVLDHMDGVRKRFTRGDLNDRGVEIFKDGRLIGLSKLNKGDEITATFVTQLPPEVVTDKEVDATLASSSSSPSPSSSSSATASADSAPANATPSPAPASEAASAAEAPPPPPAAAASALAPMPAESSGSSATWYVLILIVIAAVLFFVLRRRKDGNPPR